MIERFIAENLPQIENEEDIPEEFEKFWQTEKQVAFNKLVADEQLKAEIAEKVIGNYLFTNRKPLQNEVIETFETKPKLLQRKKLAQRVTDKMVGFVETFISGM
ncbi:type I restriction endonuclease subunit R, EcoR124 family [Flammeovirga aprica]|uniref:type I restriction endonuclease subunit R, EcoR124 family n=1 Tax=Flammeovirga aprica TaxID=29528 RepID=UPI00293BD1EB|nr:hypothetical protein [Flammeovirga aprica]